MIVQPLGERDLGVYSKATYGSSTHHAVMYGSDSNMYFAYNYSIRNKAGTTLYTFPKVALSGISSKVDYRYRLAAYDDWFYFCDAGVYVSGNYYYARVRLCAYNPVTSTAVTLGTWSEARLVYSGNVEYTKAGGDVAIDPVAGRLMFKGSSTVEIITSWFLVAYHTSLSYWGAVTLGTPTTSPSLIWSDGVGSISDDNESYYYANWAAAWDGEGIVQYGTEGSGISYKYFADSSTNSSSTIPATSSLMAVASVGPMLSRTSGSKLIRTYYGGSWTSWDPSPANEVIFLQYLGEDSSNWYVTLLYGGTPAWHFFSLAKAGTTYAELESITGGEAPISAADWDGISSGYATNGDLFNAYGWLFPPMQPIYLGGSVFKQLTFPEQEVM